MTKDELIAFEADIVREFEAGKIKAPVHLHGGNEEPLICLFSKIKSTDWVFSTHRSHYHALLKGVPPELVKTEIMAGHSISLQFSEYRFHTSAIVGGICPIALGVAMTGETVWCFVGDMAARTGIFQECLDYAQGHNLPITFVEESNGYSVDTPTASAWSSPNYNPLSLSQVKKTYYRYERTYPHQGSGKWVTF